MPTAPIEFPPPVDSAQEFVGAPTDPEDERIEVGVVIVGGVSDLIAQVKGFDAYRKVNRSRMEIMERMDKSELQAIVSAAGETPAKAAARGDRPVSLTAKPKAWRARAT